MTSNGVPIVHSSYRKAHTDNEMNIGLNIYKPILGILFLLTCKNEIRILFKVINSTYSSSRRQGDAFQKKVLGCSNKKTMVKNILTERFKVT